jgi:hypothetical protein
MNDQKLSLFDSLAPIDFDVRLLRSQNGQIGD